MEKIILRPSIKVKYYLSIVKLRDHLFDCFSTIFSPTSSHCLAVSCFQLFCNLVNYSDDIICNVVGAIICDARCTEGVNTWNFTNGSSSFCIERCMLLQLYMSTWWSFTTKMTVEKVRCANNSVLNVVLPHMFHCSLLLGIFFSRAIFSSDTLCFVENVLMPMV